VIYRARLLHLIRIHRSGGSVGALGTIAADYESALRGARDFKYETLLALK
jgi:hypothetical protein